MTKPVPPAIPQENYVLEIFRAARRLETEGDRLFQPSGLTVVQFNVLNLLRYYQPMPQAQLVQALVVGKATVSSVLGGLLKRRLIVQTGDTHDRRAKILRLSSDGAKLWAAASRDYARGLKKRLPGVGDPELEQLRKALEALRETEKK
jgi:DNA-binding MarR family transcriptional regulator